MAAPESHVRIALLDPALHAAGLTEELIRREEAPGAVEIGMTDTGEQFVMRSLDSSFFEDR